MTKSERRKIIKAGLVKRRQPIDPKGRDWGGESFTVVHETETVDFEPRDPLPEYPLIGTVLRIESKEAPASAGEWLVIGREINEQNKVVLKLKRPFDQTKL